MDLTQRQLKILSLAVEAYIETGEPVSSRALADAFGGAVSSATVRNELAVLDEHRLLSQPHTSAGRVPTHRGLRYYIDHLMQRKALALSRQRYIDSVFAVQNLDAAHVLRRALSALTDLTSCAAILSTPSFEEEVILGVDFVPAGDSLLAVILICTHAGVKTGLCRVATSEEQRAALRTVFSERLHSVPVSDITPAFIQSLAASLSQHALVAVPILHVILTLAAELQQSQVMLGGQNRLLSDRSLEASASGLFKILGDAAAIRGILQDIRGLSVLIGEETPYDEMADVSMIMSPYDAAGGAVGIVGPLSIDYADVISHIEYFAKRLGRILSHEGGER